MSMAVRNPFSKKTQERLAFILAIGFGLAVIKKVVSATLYFFSVS
jgi:hypothetical protein